MQRFARRRRTLWAYRATASLRTRNSRAKEKLPFALLADEDETLCKLFDVIKKKTLYGRKYLGIERSTFLIDADGVLRQEWRNVKVPGHAQKVLEERRRLRETGELKIVDWAP